VQTGVSHRVQVLIGKVSRKHNHWLWHLECAQLLGSDLQVDLLICLLLLLMTLHPLYLLVWLSLEPAGLLERALERADVNDPLRVSVVVLRVLVPLKGDCLGLLLNRLSRLASRHLQLGLCFRLASSHGRLAAALRDWAHVGQQVRGRRGRQDYVWVLQRREGLGTVQRAVRGRRAALLRRRARVL
jgi:hypothetical protein